MLAQVLWSTLTKQIQHTTQPSATISTQPCINATMCREAHRGMKLFATLSVAEADCGISCLLCCRTCAATEAIGRASPQLFACQRSFSTCRLWYWFSKFSCAHGVCTTWWTHGQDGFCRLSCRHQAHADMDISWGCCCHSIQYACCARRGNAMPKQLPHV